MKKDNTISSVVVNFLIILHNQFQGISIPITDRSKNFEASIGIISSFHVPTNRQRSDVMVDHNSQIKGASRMRSHNALHVQGNKP